MSDEAASDLTQLRLVADDVFLKVGEQRARELIDVGDVAEYRRDSLCWEHLRLTTRLLQVALHYITSADDNLGLPINLSVDNAT